MLIPRDSNLFKNPISFPFEERGLVIIVLRRNKKNGKLSI